MHRLIGMLLILPMLTWAFTGIIFFIKPGYKKAYEPLSVKTYPISAFHITPAAPHEWHRVEVKRTVLGQHLLLQEIQQGKAVSLHLNAATLNTFVPPSKTQLRLLVEDAIAHDASRYGNVHEVEGNTVYTTTGVRITLDWQHLRLQQYGRDTQLIDALYRVHYLQWTPWKSMNQVLGFVGLFLVFCLTLLGMRLLVRPQRKRKLERTRQSEDS